MQIACIIPVGRSPLSADVQQSALACRQRLGRSLAGPRETIADKMLHHGRVCPKPSAGRSKRGEPHWAQLPRGLLVDTLNALLDDTGGHTRPTQPIRTETGGNPYVVVCAVAYVRKPVGCTELLCRPDDGLTLQLEMPSRVLDQTQPGVCDRGLSSPMRFPDQYQPTAAVCASATAQRTMPVGDPEDAWRWGHGNRCSHRVFPVDLHLGLHQVES